MNPRFTTRTILIAMAVVACALYWRTRPTIVAADFEKAVRGRQFARADSLIVQINGTARFGEWFRSAKNLNVEQAGVTDWLSGKRQGNYTAIAKFENFYLIQEVSVTATATGVNVIATSEFRSDISRLSDISEWLPLTVQ